MKTWRIALEDGRVYHVLAPTRMLAKLVLRDPAQPGTWGPIKSIGVLRKPTRIDDPRIQCVRVK